MNVTDQDMQMVRDFLTEAKAPFHIQSHFENLVSEHAKEAARVEELEEQVDILGAKTADCDDLKREVADLNAELDQRYTDQTDALETVKYWLLDVLVHNRPMQKPPRQILRIVEDAL